MRILLLAGSYPPETGGIAQFMFSFAEGLAARGVDIDVIANPPLPPRGYLKRIEACRSEVLRRSRAAPFDRVIASSWSPYAVALPEPFDVFCHGMDLLEPSRSLRYRVLMKKTLHRARRVLANSQYTADLARTLGARPDSVRVLHPGVDSEYFKPAPPSNTETRVILSIGRLVERKGFDTVLRALPGAIKLFPDTRYLCAGDGPDRERLQRLSSDLDVANHVKWLGEVTEQQKLQLYQTADVFVMPNRITEQDGSVEGFGIVFLEAAACEVAVIAGNSGGTADAVVHELTGYLVDSTHAAELTARLTSLLSDRELRKKMGQAGRQRVVKSFRAEQIAERYLDSD